MKEISGQNSDSELEDLNKLIRIKSFGGKYEAEATSCMIKKNREMVRQMRGS